MNNISSRLPDPSIKSLDSLLQDFLEIPPGKEYAGCLRRLAPHVARLSDFFIRRTSSLPEDYLRDNNLRRAYIAYYLPVNLLKLHTPLTDLFMHPKKLLTKKRLRVLDLGSGPGTGGLGLMSFFADIEDTPFIEYSACDAVPENLKDALSLFNMFREKMHLKADMKTYHLQAATKKEVVPEGNFDLIIISNMLNEIITHKSDLYSGFLLIRGLVDRLLSEDGSCIIIEPALRKTSRDMLDIRDMLTGSGLNVYSPCISAGRCPALLDEKDWCHEDVSCNLPELVRDLDRLTGLKKDSLKFSYVILRKDKMSIADIYGCDAYRVVGDPLVSRGKREVFVCGGGRRVLARRLDRHKSAFNHDFDHLVRGSMVYLDEITDHGNRLEVVKCRMSGP